MGFFLLPVVPGIYVNSLLMEMIIRGFVMRNVHELFKLSFKKRFFTVNSRLSDVNYRLIFVVIVH